LKFGIEGVIYMGIGIGYNVHPAEIPAKVRIGVNQRTLRAQIQDIGAFDFEITPNGGDLAGDILSVVAWPIAKIVAPALKDRAVDAINGTGFDVIRLPDIPVRVRGITVTLKPTEIHLTNHEGMLCIGGALNIG
jgi:hypothetical protein